MAVTQEVCCTLVEMGRPNVRSRRFGWAACQRATGVPGAIGHWGLLVAGVLACVLGQGRPSYADHPQLRQAIDTYAAAMEKTDRNQRLEEFSRAEQLFRQVIDGTDTQPPVKNADLYVNLGNAALQAERLGPAIAAYRRALAISLHHAQASQNLAFARSQLPDWARRDDGIGLLDSLLFWRGLLTREQTMLASAICFLIAAVLVAVGVSKRRAWPRNVAILPLLAWLTLILSLWLTTDLDVKWDAVAVAETTVYTADSENSAPRLAKPLPSGTELSVIQQRERWVEVLLPDGRSGWVLAATIDRL